MKRALIPYAGKPVWRPSRPDLRLVTAKKEQGDNLHSISAVPNHIDEEEWPEAIRLFREGHDSVAIASALNCTTAAAANGLARALDRERRQ